MKKLPNIDSYPSVLEVFEVEEIFLETFKVLEENSSNSNGEVADLFVDILTAQGYRLEKMSHKVEVKIMNWIKLNWDSSDFDLTDACCTILANLNLQEASQFIDSELESSTDKEIISILEETKEDKDNHKVN